MAATHRGPEFAERFVDLAGAVGLPGVVAEGEDEHARFAVYQRAASQDATRPLLERCLELEPDHALRTSVLADLLARMPSGDRPRLVGLGSASGQAFLAQRAVDLDLLDRLVGPTVGSPLPDELVEQLVTGTDWLQRGAVERTSSPEVLRVLADRGRTRKVRAAASQRSMALEA